MISALMLEGGQPTLARDTMYSVIMIVLAGLVGICLLLGGIKFHEQSFNLRGASSYLSMIIPLAAIGLVLPDFTRSSPYQVFSPPHAMALVILSVAIYSVFLLMQTSRYRGFFTVPAETEGLHPHVESSRSNFLHAALLIIYMIPVVLLAKKLAGVLDFTTEAGKAVLHKLVQKADVLVENYKVGGLQKAGLDYATLSLINPQLIYCSITGFGQHGPYAQRPGYDALIQAMGGLMSITGEPDGAPQKVGVAVVDILTGLYATNAILAALIHRSRTQQGQHIDIALLDVQVAALANQKTIEVG